MSTSRGTKPTHSGKPVMPRRRATVGARKQQHASKPHRLKSRLQQNIWAAKRIDIDQIEEAVLQIGLTQQPLRRLMDLVEHNPIAGMQGFEIGG